MLRCNKCGMEVDVSTYKRCPRCNTIINIPLKCSECKGCSIYKTSGKTSQNCPTKEKSNV